MYSKDYGGLPFPSLGDVPGPGIELGSSALQAVSLPFEPPRKPYIYMYIYIYIYIYTHTHTHQGSHTYICTHTPTYTHKGILGGSNG